MRELDYNELLGKYQALIAENDRLKIEINKLKSQTPSFEQCQTTVDETSLRPRSSINRNSKTNDKIALFRSLFQGRTDVFAKRWQNKQGKSGYSPVCLNEWKNGVCGKPIVKCSNCSNKSYKPLDESVVTDHLLGSIVIGIYPMLPDETCLFLSIDFDDGNWKSDISAIRDTCNKFNIPAAFERSRSGNGAHVWFFFTDRIESSIARKFGSALITYAMNKRHEITFKSYDRFFPNQDTMPKGGLGNLIALPLQKEARKMGNSEFIDENFSAYRDQWAFLADVNKLSREMLEELIAGLCRGNELGDLKADEEDSSKPWTTPKKVNLTNADFPKSISIAKANMLFVPKKEISQKALTHLKRLAAFKNPEFFKAQAMRMPTFNKPRIISCSDETEEYLCLPRGCEDDLKAVFSNLKIDLKITDHTQHCRKFDLEFKGILRDEQSIAFNQLSKFDTGVLCGTTAFGKTVVALKLIAEKKVNTLILVNRKNLASQWEKKISEFIIIRENISNHDSSSQKRIKKVKSIVGIIGAGKNTANGIIDIALIQSLVKSDEIKNFVKNYGMIIVDECHHIAAFSFEQVLKTANAKFVYGLTATPARKDGHHPIIFMQCGPIKYRDDAKKQADGRPFEHFIVPRFTSLKIPLDKDETDLDINNLYSEIVSNEIRNQLIVSDIISGFEAGRNSLVLTERTEHVETLTKRLKDKIPDVLTLTGRMRTRDIKTTLRKISDTPANNQLTIVATGKYIGEGFDEPRLDTLYLTMPISWKGTLQQYAGRLHRLFETKKEVQIFDYIDINVKMLEKMYHKRLNGYSSIGYKIKGNAVANEPFDIIFDNKNFLPVYSNDILNTTKEILIVSPFIRKKRVLSALEQLKEVKKRQIKVTVLTRPPEDFKEKDQPGFKDALKILNDSGIQISYKSNIHQKFAIIDQKIIWYGSINLLSFGNAEESIMRLESTQIATELMISVENYL